MKLIKIKHLRVSANLFRGLSSNIKCAGAVTVPRSKKTVSTDNPGSSFQCRCASALRLAFPIEIKAHGAVLAQVDMDSMAASLAQTRKSMDLNRLDVSPASSLSERRQSKVRANAFAR